MREGQRTHRTESEITKLLNELLKRTPACRGAKFGPIIQRDVPGEWTVHLRGYPSGACQSAFIAIRSELQHQIALKPYERRYL